MASQNRVSLRIANIDDLELVNFWDTQPHVIESDPDDDWNWEVELARFPAWREQLVAEVDGEPIGFIQIIDPFEEETHYWGDVDPNLRAIDIWIGETKFLNRGLGTEMMQLAIEKCFANSNVDSILIDPLETNQNAIRFYQRVGFEFVERRKFDDLHCLVHRLTREQWDALNPNRS